MEPRELLSLIAFFSESLDAKQLDMLAERAQRRSFSAGAVLIREFEPGASMFILESGEVAVTVSDEAEPVARLFVGDVVGEMSLLTGAPRSATVTAVEPVMAVEIDHGALAPILATAPMLADRFAEILQRRQKELQDLHGGAAWGVLLPPDAELSGLIQAFYR